MVPYSVLLFRNVTLHETAPVSGFRRHAFNCSICGDSGQRLAWFWVPSLRRPFAVIASGDMLFSKKLGPAGLSPCR
jgi:hypothetical protein